MLHPQVSVQPLNISWTLNPKLHFKSEIILDLGQKIQKEKSNFTCFETPTMSDFEKPTTVFGIAFFHFKAEIISDFSQKIQKKNQILQALKHS